MKRKKKRKGKNAKKKKRDKHRPSTPHDLLLTKPKTLLSLGFHFALTIFQFSYNPSLLAKNLVIYPPHSTPVQKTNEQSNDITVRK